MTKTSFKCFHALISSLTDFSIGIVSELYMFILQILLFKNNGNFILFSKIL